MYTEPTFAQPARRLSARPLGRIEEIMDIGFSGKLNRSDAIVFIDLLNHPIIEKGKSFMSLWTILVYIGIALCLTGLFIVINGSLIGISLIIIAVAILIGSYNGKKRQIKQIGDQFEKALPIEGIINEEGIHIKSQLIDNSIKWRAYTGYGEKENYYMLFENNVMVLCLKRDYFGSEEEWKNAIGMVTKNIKKQYGFEKGKDKFNIWNLISLAIIIFLALYLFLTKVLPDGFVQRLYKESLSKVVVVQESESLFWKVYIKEICFKRLTKLDVISHFHTSEDAIRKYAFDRSDVKPYQGNILILAGEKDPVSTESDWNAMARFYPHSRIKIIPGAGHTAGMSDPKKYAKIVNEFLIEDK
jgi:hypothetical protein